jgi:hypothetical protein
MSNKKEYTVEVTETRAYWSVERVTAENQLAAEELAEQEFFNGWPDSEWIDGDIVVLTEDGQPVKRSEEACRLDPDNPYVKESSSTKTAIIEPESK